MNFNNKKLERTSKAINYSVSGLLCIFLIALSANILDDVDEWEEMPGVETYQDNELIKSNEALIDSLENELGQWYTKKSGIQASVDLADANYQSEKESYENWLAARKTIGSPNQDQNVLRRAEKLDEHYKIAQEWRREIAGVDQEIFNIQDFQNQLRNVNSEETERAWKIWEDELKGYEMKVFLIRLAIILPILLIGIFFALKFRSHKYWPIFLGYILFSGYAFFVGLVPYLPSYGGYVRYTVGIILSILLGIYSINKVRAFVERKKNELKESSEDRAKKVESEVAEKALDNHQCPSCGKDFIVKKWGLAKAAKLTTDNFAYVTDFCRYCGLELFKKCRQCGTSNYAHLPFCSGCGDKVMDSKEA